jgi:hypothetical protein
MDPAEALATQEQEGTDNTFYDVAPDIIVPVEPPSLPSGSSVSKYDIGRASVARIEEVMAESAAQSSLRVNYCQRQYLIALCERLVMDRSELTFAATKEMCEIVVLAASEESVDDSLWEECEESAVTTAIMCMDSYLCSILLRAIARRLQTRESKLRLHSRDISLMQRFLWIAQSILVALPKLDYSSEVAEQVFSLLSLLCVLEDVRAEARAHLECPLKLLNARSTTPVFMAAARFAMSICGSSADAERLGQRQILICWSRRWKESDEALLLAADYLSIVTYFSQSIGESIVRHHLATLYAMCRSPGVLGKRSAARVLLSLLDKFTSLMDMRCYFEADIIVTLLSLAHSADPEAVLVAAECTCLLVRNPEGCTIAWRHRILDLWRAMSHTQDPALISCWALMTISLVTSSSEALTRCQRLLAPERLYQQWLRDGMTHPPTLMLLTHAQLVMFEMGGGKYMQQWLEQKEKENQDAPSVALQLLSALVVAARKVIYEGGVDVHALNIVRQDVGEGKLFQLEVCSATQGHEVPSLTAAGLGRHPSPQAARSPSTHSPTRKSPGHPAWAHRRPATPSRLVQVRGGRGLRQGGAQAEVAELLGVMLAAFRSWALNTQVAGAFVEEGGLEVLREMFDFENVLLVTQLLEILQEFCAVPAALAWCASPPIMQQLKQCCTLRHAPIHIKVNEILNLCLRNPVLKRTVAVEGLETIFGLLQSSVAEVVCEVCDTLAAMLVEESVREEFLNKQGLFVVTQCLTEGIEKVVLCESAIYLMQKIFLSKEVRQQVTAQSTHSTLSVIALLWDKYPKNKRIGRCFLHIADALYEEVGYIVPEFDWNRIVSALIVPDGIVQARALRLIRKQAATEMSSAAAKRPGFTCPILKRNGLLSGLMSVFADEANSAAIEATSICRLMSEQRVVSKDIMADMFAAGGKGLGFVVNEDTLVLWKASYSLVFENSHRLTTMLSIVKEVHKIDDLSGRDLNVSIDERVSGSVEAAAEFLDIVAKDILGNKRKEQVVMLADLGFFDALLGATQCSSPILVCKVVMICERVSKLVAAGTLVCDINFMWRSLHQIVSNMALIPQKDQDVHDIDLICATCYETLLKSEVTSMVSLNSCLIAGMFELLREATSVSCIGKILACFEMICTQHVLCRQLVDLQFLATVAELTQNETLLEGEFSLFLPILHIVVSLLQEIGDEAADFVPCELISLLCRIIRTTDDFKITRSSLLALESIMSHVERCPAYALFFLENEDGISLFTDLSQRVSPYYKQSIAACLSAMMCCEEAVDSISSEEGLHLITRCLRAESKITTVKVVTILQFIAQRGYSDCVVEYGGLRTVLSLLNSNNKEAKVIAGRTFVFLLDNPKTQDVLLNKVGIMPVIGLAATGDSDSLIACSRCLFSLSKSSAKIVEQLLADGAVRALLNIMKYGEVDQAEEAAKTLQNLCRTRKLCEQMLAAGGIASLNLLIKRGGCKGQIQAGKLVLLLVRYDTLRAQLLDMDLLLVFAMFFSLGNKEVNAIGASGMRITFDRYEERCRTPLLNLYPVLEAVSIVDPLAAAIDLSEIVVLLAKHPENCLQLVKLGVVKLILKSFSRCDELSRAFSKVVLCLAREEAVLMTLLDQGIMQFIISVIKVGTEQSGLKESAEALALIVNNEDSAAYAVKSGSLTEMLPLASSSNKNVQLIVLSSIEKMISYVSVSTEFLRIGGLDVAEAMAFSSFSSVRAATCALLSNLICTLGKNPELLQLFIDKKSIALALSLGMEEELHCIPSSARMLQVLAGYDGFPGEFVSCRGLEFLKLMIISDDTETTYRTAFFLRRLAEIPEFCEELLDAHIIKMLDVLTAIDAIEVALNCLTLLDRLVDHREFHRKLLDFGLSDWLIALATSAEMNTPRFSPNISAVCSKILIRLCDNPDTNVLRCISLGTLSILATTRACMRRSLSMDLQILHVVEIFATRSSALEEMLDIPSSLPLIAGLLASSSDCEDLQNRILDILLGFISGNDDKSLPIYLCKANLPSSCLVFCERECEPRWFRKLGKVLLYFCRASNRNDVASNIDQPSIVPLLRYFLESSVNELMVVGLMCAVALVSEKTSQVQRLVMEGITVHPLAAMLAISPTEDIFSRVIQYLYSFRADEDCMIWLFRNGLLELIDALSSIESIKGVWRRTIAEIVLCLSETGGIVEQLSSGIAAPLKRLCFESVDEKEKDGTCRTLVAKIIANIVAYSEKAACAFGEGNGIESLVCACRWMGHKEVRHELCRAFRGFLCSSKNKEQFIANNGLKHLYAIHSGYHLSCEESQDVAVSYFYLSECYNAISIVLDGLTDFMFSIQHNIPCSWSSMWTYHALTTCLLRLMRHNHLLEVCHKKGVHKVLVPIIMSKIPNLVYLVLSAFGVACNLPSFARIFSAEEDFWHSFVVILNHNPRLERTIKDMLDGSQDLEEMTWKDVFGNETEAILKHSVADVTCDSLIAAAPGLMACCRDESAMKMLIRRGGMEVLRVGTLLSNVSCVEAVTECIQVLTEITLEADLMVLVDSGILEACLTLANSEEMHVRTMTITCFNNMCQNRNVRARVVKERESMKAVLLFAEADNATLQEGAAELLQQFASLINEHEALLKNGGLVALSVLAKSKARSILTLVLEIVVSLSHHDDILVEIIDCKIMDVLHTLAKCTPYNDADGSFAASTLMTVGECLLRFSSASERLFELYSKYHLVQLCIALGGRNVDTYLNSSLIFERLCRDSEIGKLVASDANSLDLCRNMVVVSNLGLACHEKLAEDLLLLFGDSSCIGDACQSGYLVVLLRQLQLLPSWNVASISAQSLMSVVDNDNTASSWGFPNMLTVLDTAGCTAVDKADQVTALLARQVLCQCVAVMASYDSMIATFPMEKFSSIVVYFANAGDSVALGYLLEACCSCMKEAQLRLEAINLGVLKLLSTKIESPLSDTGSKILLQLFADSELNDKLIPSSFVGCLFQYASISASISSSAVDNLVQCFQCICKEVNIPKLLSKDLILSLNYVGEALSNDKEVLIIAEILETLLLGQKWDRRVVVLGGFGPWATLCRYPCALLSMEKCLSAVLLHTKPTEMFVPAIENNIFLGLREIAASGVAESLRIAAEACCCLTSSEEAVLLCIKFGCLGALKVLAEKATDVAVLKDAGMTATSLCGKEELRLPFVEFQGLDVLVALAQCPEEELQAHAGSALEMLTLNEASMKSILDLPHGLAALNALAKSTSEIVLSTCVQALSNLSTSSMCIRISTDGGLSVLSTLWLHGIPRICEQILVIMQRVCCDGEYLVAFIGGNGISLLETLIYDDFGPSANDEQHTMDSKMSSQEFAVNVLLRCSSDVSLALNLLSEQVLSLLHYLIASAMDNIMNAGGLCDDIATLLDVIVQLEQDDELVFKSSFLSLVSKLVQLAEPQSIARFEKLLSVLHRTCRRAVRQDFEAGRKTGYSLYSAETELHRNGSLALSTSSSSNTQEEGVVSNIFLDSEAQMSSSMKELDVAVPVIFSAVDVESVSKIVYPNHTKEPSLAAQVDDAFFIHKEWFELQAKTLKLVQLWEGGLLDCIQTFVNNTSMKAEWKLVEEFACIVRACFRPYCVEFCVSREMVEILQTVVSRVQSMHLENPSQKGSTKSMSEILSGFLAISRVSSQHFNLIDCGFLVIVGRICEMSGSRSVANSTLTLVHSLVVNHELRIRILEELGMPALEYIFDNCDTCYQPVVVKILLALMVNPGNHAQFFESGFGLLTRCATQASATDRAAILGGLLGVALIPYVRHVLCLSRGICGCVVMLMGVQRELILSHRASLPLANSATIASKTGAIDVLSRIAYESSILEEDMGHGGATGKPGILTALGVSILGALSNLETEELVTCVDEDFMYILHAASFSVDEAIRYATYRIMVRLVATPVLFPFLCAAKFAKCLLRHLMRSFELTEPCKGAQMLLVLKLCHELVKQALKPDSPSEDAQLASAFSTSVDFDGSQCLCILLRFGLVDCYMVFAHVMEELASKQTILSSLELILADDAQVAAFCERQGLLVLYALMTKSMNAQCIDESELEKTCHLLVQVSSVTETHLYFCSQNGMCILLEMTSSPSDVVKTCSAGVLKNLSENKNQRDDIVRLGVMEPLSTLTESHDPRVQTLAAQALVNFSMCDSMISKGGFSPILKLCSSPIAQIRQVAFTTIANITERKALLLSIVSEGVVPFLMEMRYDSDAIVAKECIRALLNLSASDSEPEPEPNVSASGELERSEFRKGISSSCAPVQTLVFADTRKSLTVVNLDAGGAFCLRENE